MPILLLEWRIPIINLWQCFCTFLALTLLGLRGLRPHFWLLRRLINQRLLSILAIYFWRFIQNVVFNVITRQIDQILFRFHLTCLFKRLLFSTLRKTVYLLLRSVLLVCTRIICGLFCHEVKRKNNRFLLYFSWCRTAYRISFTAQEHLIEIIIWFCLLNLFFGESRCFTLFWMSQIEGCSFLVIQSLHSWKHKTNLFYLEGTFCLNSILCTLILLAMVILDLIFVKI